MLCTASDTFRIILAYSVLCFFRYTSAYSIIFSILKGYSLILRHYYYGIFRVIQAYSSPFVILPYSQPYHILSPGIFRIRGLFKTLWNIDEAYSEPFHRVLFSHIQAYSEPYAKLAYAETWYTQNPEIFRARP